VVWPVTDTTDPRVVQIPDHCLPLAPDRHIRRAPSRRKDLAQGEEKSGLQEARMKVTTKRGAIWDLDGVLADTGELHYLAWSQVLPEYGLPFSWAAFQSTFGMNNAGILALLFGRTPEPGLVAEISERKEAAFRQAVVAAPGRLQPLPGVRDWLERLRATGFRQAIASSAPPENIETLVNELGLRACFDALVSGFALPGKPDPATFLQAAHAIDVPAARCVVVEDAVHGVEGARRAGMKCIAVTTTTPADALAAADLVVERLDALPLDAFERLVNRG
jgi:HAD superfamily hydrolase (TIGR01509 family)